MPPLEKRHAHHGGAGISAGTWLSCLLQLGLLCTLFCAFAVLMRLDSLPPQSHKMKNMPTSLRKQGGKSDADKRSIMCPYGETAARGVVNDDYCDCVDNNNDNIKKSEEQKQRVVKFLYTDEPATSACSYSLVGVKVFKCGTRDDAPALFLSRVHDGVCDCCNGRDEVGSPFFERERQEEEQQQQESERESPCPNTCLSSLDKPLQVFARLANYSSSSGSSSNNQVPKANPNLRQKNKERGARDRIILANLRKRKESEFEEND